MTPQDLIAAFETLAEAPNGVPRLRELVLELAVRGRLVPQDPNDEPATELIPRLAAGRNGLVEDGLINKLRHPSGVVVEDEPYEVPESWVWLRLGDIGAIVGGGTPKSGESQYWANGDGIPWLTPADMKSQASRYVERGARNITEAGLAESSTQLMPKGAVLFSSRAPIGHVGIAANPLTTNQGFKSCVPYISAMAEYVYLYLKKAGREIDATATGTTFREVSGKDVSLVVFPLPPLAEQQRIVARVDELMGLLDRLEAARNTREETRVALRDAALATLQDADTPDEVEVAWNRISERMDDLLIDPGDVEPLRQTVLQLAVRGRLVPQDPNDEPASVLLERIAKAKARLVKEGKIRKPTALTPLADARKPFALPPGWSWCRFTDVGELARGRSKHRPRNDPALYVRGDIPMVQTGDIARAKGPVTTFTALYNKKGLEQSRLWHSGTMCITIAANIADTAILGFDACFPDSVVGFLPFKPIPDARYFEFFMRTAQSALEDFAPSTAQKNINLAILDELLIPLPPLKELEGIVAKVDELMALLDRLEQRLSAKTITHDAFAAAAVHHLDA